MKKLTAIAFICTAIFADNAFSQNNNVGIGTLTPDSSAILELSATNKGILIPRTDTNAVNNLPGTPANGLLIYQITDKLFYYFDGTFWKPIGAGSGSAGPIGPTGPQGAQGIPGTTGAQGPQGIQGTAGADGATGPQGPQGIQGIAGVDGVTGAQGPQGIQGIPGPTGADGATGAQGPTGTGVGIPGPTGADGAAGPTGPTGPAGADGATGTQGADGVTGPQGAQGVQGPTGVAGATGADGALNAWSLTGNAATSPPTNFIGTTDANDWVIRTNNIERVRVLSAGNVGINTSTPGSAFLNVTSANSGVDAIRAFHTSGSTVSAFYAVGGDVNNVAYTHATGYLGYHNSTANLTFSVYGNGGNLAGMFNGKVGINTVATQITSYDLEVRNTSIANPTNVLLRQTTSNTALNSVLANLDFGDDYNQSPQARIQVFRDNASSGSTDLPTAFAFSTMADGASTLTERMRITDGGLVGINMTPAMQLDVTSASTTSADAAIRGEATANAAVYGVKGTVTSTTNTAAGVFGLASGTSGQIHGVLGQTYSTTGNSSAVRGYAGGATGATLGVWGENASSSSNATGVYGICSSATGNVNGVWGSISSTGAGASAVYGTASGGTGTYGLYAVNSGNNGNGIYGECSVGAGAYGIWGKSTTGEAGHFTGNVTVTGTLSKGGGSFKIDHPLDPENKYLYHSFVESPDMLNVYNGNIITNENGEAVVNLPSYFEAENMDYKYQLTVIGQPDCREACFAQAIIQKEISENKFMIKTDKPNVKVSWQVTGVRNDKWAQKYRIPNEVEKTSAEKGKYLHPELYGVGEDKSIEYLRHTPKGEK